MENKFYKVTYAGQSTDGFDYIEVTPNHYGAKTVTLPLDTPISEIDRRFGKFAKKFLVKAEGEVMKL